MTDINGAAGAAAERADIAMLTGLERTQRASFAILSPAVAVVVVRRGEAAARALDRPVAQAAPATFRAHERTAAAPRPPEQVAERLREVVAAFRPAT